MNTVTMPTRSLLGGTGTGISVHHLVRHDADHSCTGGSPRTDSPDPLLEAASPAVAEPVRAFRKA
jgi:hypothetical protein